MKAAQGSPAARPSGGPGPEPVVASVIVPVWNVAPYLAQCLDSALGQSIGLERLEVIAVDDGSTDGSGELLDGYGRRHPQVIVVHQPNSGGPGGPRNVGLGRATGRYVFFLDGDDYLGPEALERMVAMAERFGSDVVLGKSVGVDGRPVPSRAFRRTVGRARVEDVFTTLSVLKLFRRSLIEQLGLRFPEGIGKGEDSSFTARAYLGANGISVVADYDCYYLRHREGSQTRSGSTYDFAADMSRLGDLIELVAGASRPRSARDRMFAHLVGHVVRLFGPRWRELGPEARRDVFDRGAAIVGRWGSPGVLRLLPPWLVLKAHCLAHGLRVELEDVAAVTSEAAFARPLVEGRRLFARYPHFRDPAGIPDRCFDITSRVAVEQQRASARVADGTLHVSGRAFLALVGGSTTIVLRRWPGGPRHRFATEALDTPDQRDTQYLRRVHRAAGFDVAIDLATAASGRPLGPGSWDILLEVGTDEVRRTSPLRAAGATIARSGGLYVTRAGTVRLRVGPPSVIGGLLERAEVAWSRASRIRRRAGRWIAARR